MEFEEFSKKTIQEINKELKVLLKEWRSEVATIDKNLLPLIDKFIQSCNGGKMLRGVLVVLGYEIAEQPSDKSKKENLKAIFKIAAAYEIMHSAILAHDDVIDESLLRRGKKSLFKALGGNHTGISKAICLGDAGFFLAMKIIAESNFHDKEKNQAIQFFAQTMIKTALGQILDIQKGDVTKIMDLKTAKYTISGPLQLGAILAGETTWKVGFDSFQVVQFFEEFGEGLGVAFQIQDDILGIFGSEKEIGKSVTSDIEEGKNTILYQYALKKANEKQKQTLKKFYGRGKIDDQELKEVRKIFKETKALEFAEKEAEKYKTQAMKVIPKITSDQSLSILLKQMGEYLVRRTR